MFEWIVTHPVAYPALEVVHILGIALLVGNLVLLETRVWGLNAGLHLEPLARATLVLAVGGFGLALASGLLMFASNPWELIANRSFVVKMGLLTLAGGNAALFHARGGVRKPDRIARAQTALSLALWIAVIIAGRWIAYI
ncbi:MAG: hypothetical protein MUC74_03370 [Ideonella sp.]|jgi:peptidoglycan/LPS O-acetylase OafA/YrhL|nr:hypothetical protein [Ideonella sp.]